MSLICQAKPLTRLFIVEFQHDSDSPNRHFSIKRARHALPDEPSDITGTNGYKGSPSPPDHKRHDSYACKVKTSIIKSISWQWLYATHLLVAYELTVATKETPPVTTPYSWLSVELIITVGWLLKNYWISGPPLFKPFEQHEAASMLTKGDQAFAIITMMLNSGNTPQQHQPPESFSQQDPQATPQSTGSFRNPFYTDSGGSDGGPQQQLHTLGLNCFVYPCNGVCKFRSSFNSSESAEWPLNSADSPTGQQLYCNVPTLGDLPISSDDLVIVNALLNLRGLGLIEKTGMNCALVTQTTGTSETQQTTAGSSQWDTGLPHLSRAETIQTTDDSAKPTCDVTVVEKDGQKRPCGRVYKNAKSLSAHKRKGHPGQRTCAISMIGKDGQQQSCATICSNVQALVSHKSRCHSGQQTCDVKVIGRGSQKQPCGRVCKSPRTLLGQRHKLHSRQKTCVVTVTGEDGQQRPCGTICKNSQALSNHKRRSHTGQQTCDISVVGEDGQRQPCGTICGNVQALASHKSRYHTGLRTCDISVAGEDGQPRPCGKVCNNSKALSDHKRRQHTKQQTCDVKIVAKDGQLRPCGTVCKSARTLSDHRQRVHREQKNCGAKVAAMIGQPRPCGRVCISARALTDHKRVHRKRKSGDADTEDDLSPQRAKVNK
ncbi:hypothetical protein [Endozoicomonas sp. 8E]|uniref:hypothetical protein n=1 Tax=Endozoicomonas sp. 8E TaxID=3035692 RepID=UPI0029393C92|nr:hypothetical protein [Endozoicomonas sp. 8E]WOG27125.1 hypothetical protein P6910_21620 [Endozoicomonas sp. 8E]